MRNKRIALVAGLLGGLSCGLLSAHAADRAASGYYYMMVFNNPVAGREQEFDRWYVEHVPEVLERAGFTEGQHYAAVASVLGPAPRRFLTLYQIVTDDIAGFYRGFGPAPTPGAAPPNPGPIDMATNVNVTYQSTGQSVPGAAAKGEADAADREAVFVLSMPKAGSAADSQRWYAQRFAAHVRSLPAVISAQHFVLSPAQQFDRQLQAAPDLVLYIVRAKDFQALEGKTRQRWLQGPSQSDVSAYVYRPIGPLVPAPHSTRP